MMLHTILLVSLGSIGKRHLQNLLKIHPKVKIIVLRSHSTATAISPLQTLALQNNIIEVYSLDDALTYHPQAAIIASPCVFHIEQMQVLLKNNIHVLVEKPLSHSLKHTEQLIVPPDVTIMVGYVLRFKSVMIQLKQLLVAESIGNIVHISVNCGSYLPDWRQGQDYRHSVSARKELGGGVLLELSHEFDYMLWLFGGMSTLVAHVGYSQLLDINVEDSADIIIQFKTGASATLHLDFLQKKPQRKLTISGTKGNICCDLIHETIEVNTTNADPTHFSYQQDHNEPYLLELKRFFQCIEHKEKPPITIIDGKNVLQVIQAIHQSSVEKKWVEV